MCIAAPAKVVEINREKESLFADFGGVRQEAKRIFRSLGRTFRSS